MQPPQDDKLAQTFNIEEAQTIGHKLAESNEKADKGEVEKKKSMRGTDSEVIDAYFLPNYVSNCLHSNYIISCIQNILCNVALRN